MQKFVQCWLAASAAAVSSQACAQGEEGPAPSEAITVTAKMSCRQLEHCAGSATVLDENGIAERHIDDFTALGFAAPNVSLDAIGTFRGVANFSIRGLGINSSIPSIDPAVGLFVDNVYMGTNAGTLFDALDVTSVELLRGPQSVLFGRNTTGGAVLVTTGDPTWDWRAKAQANFEVPLASGRGAPLATVRAVLSGPVNERLAFRIAALHTTDGGYFRNAFDGSDFGAAETDIVRAGATFRPTERFSLTAKLEWSRSDGDGAPGHNNGLFPRDSFRVSLDEQGYYHSRSKMATLRADLDAGNGRLTNIAAWRDYRLRTRNDIDSSPLPVFHSDTGTAARQWSEELFYHLPTRRADLLVGAYVFGQRQGYDEDRNLAGLGLPSAYGGGKQRHRVYAVYGNADIHASDDLTLSAGLRWSREEKRAAITYIRARAACSAIAGTCPLAGERVSGENNGFTDARAWNAVSPRLGMTYRLDDTASLYLGWTRGERSGGYNFRITQPAAFEQVADEAGSAAFDAERVDGFEAGLKWRAPGGTAAVDIALFWTEVRNMQREISVASPTSGLAQSVYNTADARIRGGEFEARYTLAPGFEMSASAGYIDAQYRRIFFDISGDNRIDSSDAALQLPRAPRWTWGAGARLSRPLGSSMLIARADFQRRGRYAYTDNNFGWVGAIGSLDASIGVEFARPAVRVSFYGRNLLDAVQFGGDTQLGFAGGPNSDGNNRPFDPRPAAGTFSPLMKGRRVGLELSASF